MTIKEAIAKLNDLLLFYTEGEENTALTFGIQALEANLKTPNILPIEREQIDKEWEAKGEGKKKQDEPSDLHVIAELYKDCKDMGFTHQQTCRLIKNAQANEEAKK